MDSEVYDGKDLALVDVIRIGDINQKNLSYAESISPPVHIRDSIYTRYIKRGMDIVIALIALILFLPVNAILAVITYFDVGRPILFRQKRTGKDKKTFEIVKFRNMTEARDQDGKLLSPDQRVTKWGRFVRRTSLDELLNFWPVLKGDMSIIGPRPLHDFYTDWMSERHAARFAVRPGLECPMLHRNMNATDWQERFENDVWYVENCSIITDIRLLLRLVQITVFPQNRKEREESTGAFIGYNEQGIAISVRMIPKDVMEEFEAQTVAAHS